MPTALKNLKIKHVSLVDRPANQGADVVLAKRDDADEDDVEKAAKRKRGGTGMAMGMQDPDAAADATGANDDDEDDVAKQSNTTTPPPAQENRTVDTETQVTKADLEAIRKQYEDTVTELKKSVDDITARAVQAESVAKAEADARETREAIAKAEREYATLPGTTPTDTGTLLREIGKSVAAETVAKLETLLKSASAAIAKGNLFTESGATGNANTTDSPVAKLETIAKGLRESDPKLSPSQAITKAVELNPELASEYRKQFAPAGGYKQYS